MTPEEKYEKSMIEQGFKRTKVWVPEKLIELLHAIAAAMRALSKSK